MKHFWKAADLDYVTLSHFIGLEVFLHAEASNTSLKNLLVIGDVLEANVM